MRKIRAPPGRRGRRLGARVEGRAVVLEGEDCLVLEPDRRLDRAGWTPVIDDVGRHLVEHDLDVMAVAPLDLPRVQDGAQPGDGVAEALGRRREAENVLGFHERVARDRLQPRMTTVTVSPRNLEAVFFDIGGTLVRPNLALLGTWLRAAGIDCDDERVSLVEPFARRSHALRREAVVGTPGIRGLYLEELIRHVWEDRPGDPALLQSAVDQILATAMAAGHAAVPVRNQVLPGVPEGLAALRARGLRLVAVSNSDGSAEAVLVATGLRDWFEAVIDSHHVGFSKPDPRLFDAARAVLGVQARNVAHVGYGCRNASATSWGPMPPASGPS